MAQLIITEKTARGIYPSASGELRRILEETFTPEQLCGKITDRIKTLADACIVCDVNPDEIGDAGLEPDEVAYRKLKIIVAALNEGWKPNWNDEDQYKYYPWFYMNDQDGFRFNVAVYYYTYSSVGSRLCFKTRELAEYAAKQFVDIYKTFFTS